MVAFCVFAMIIFRSSTMIDAMFSAVQFLLTIFLVADDFSFACAFMLIFFAAKVTAMKFVGVAMRSASCPAFVSLDVASIFDTVTIIARFNDAMF